MGRELVDSILDWNPWQSGDFPVELLGLPRDYNLVQYLGIPEIKVLEGARRVGKSTLLYQMIKHVLDKGEKVLYLNFDDTVIQKVPLAEIIDVMFDRFSFDHLFIDEIQSCSDWVQTLRKFHDQKRFNQIWVTGSNSHLIKEEYATYLTGRHISIHVNPLGFAEVLRFKNIEYDIDDLSTRSKNKIKTTFEDYMQLGGFPAIVMRESMQRELLINYFNDFVYKDIASRHQINSSKLYDLGVFIATNSSREFSYRTATKILGVHQNTVNTYTGYYKSIFLFSDLFKFDYSLKKQITYDRKMYCVDIGIAQAVAFRFSEDRGAVLENLVHNELIRRNLKAYFYKGKGECDFIIKDGIDIVQAIQVTVTMQNPSTYKREVNGLCGALEAFGLSQGIIITEDESDQLDIEHQGKSYHIIVMPAWEWCLKNKGMNSI